MAYQNYNIRCPFCICTESSANWAEPIYESEDLSCSRHSHILIWRGFIPIPLVIDPQTRIPHLMSVLSEDGWKIQRRNLLKLIQMYETGELAALTMSMAVWIRNGEVFISANTQSLINIMSTPLSRILRELQGIDYSLTHINWLWSLFLFSWMLWQFKANPSRPTESQAIAPLIVVFFSTREAVHRSHQIVEKLCENTSISMGVLIGSKEKPDPKPLMGCDIILAAPGRFVNYLLGGDISTGRLQRIILDEAIGTFISPEQRRQVSIILDIERRQRPLETAGASLVCLMMPCADSLTIVDYFMCEQRVRYAVCTEEQSRVMDFNQRLLFR